MKKTSAILRFISVLVTLTVTINCQQQKKLIPGEGWLTVTGGKIWYRITGNGDKTPILLLHGGPGVPGYYLKPLEALGKDRPLIFFDPLGCGKSDRISDTSLMTIKQFVNEVSEVTSQLGLKEYYLYGHSWGTMLGTEYYLDHPAGIKALILSSPAHSVPMWMKDADTLIALLPDFVQKSIRVNEQNKTYDSPAYKQAIQTYYQNYVARKLPWSADIDSCFSQMGENIYKHMGGPSEFTITGELKNFDQTNRLREIKVPTLFLCGQYDEARPSTVKYYQSLVPGAKFSMIENAGHFTMQDNPEQDIKAISEFLAGIENK